MGGGEWGSEEKHSLSFESKQSPKAQGRVGRRRGEVVFTLAGVRDHFRPQKKSMEMDGERKAALNTCMEYNMQLQTEAKWSKTTNRRGSRLRSEVTRQSARHGKHYKLVC